MSTEQKSKKQYLKEYYDKNREELLDKQRIRNKANYQQNKERDQLKNSLWAKNNPERMRELQTNHRNTEKNKSYRKNHNQDNMERNKLTARIRRLKGYGLTLDQYDEMHKSQNGKCKICQRTSKEASENRKGDLVVDHCHVTKKVRGLLCHHCNAALGQFQDSIELLTKAIKYLSC